MISRLQGEVQGSGVGDIGEEERGYGHGTDLEDNQWSR